jgi:hypothetical protein
MTPVRRLDGVTYWVIEDYEGIHDFVNTEVRKEWEADAEFEGRKPSESLWLKTLSRRRWSLEMMEISQIKLDPRIIVLLTVKEGTISQKSLSNVAVSFKRRSKSIALSFGQS